MGARSHAIDLAPPSFDPDQVLAQIADLRLDLPCRAPPDPDTANKVGHADADAQHGKPAAQRVARQGTQRAVQCQHQGHTKAPSHAGSQKSTVDTAISRALDTKKGLLKRPAPCGDRSSPGSSIPPDHIT